MKFYLLVMLHAHIGWQESLFHRATELYHLQQVTSSVSEIAWRIIECWLLNVTASCSSLTRPHHTALPRVGTRATAMKHLVQKFKEVLILRVMQAQYWHFCDFWAPYWSHFSSGLGLPSWKRGRKYNVSCV